MMLVLTAVPLRLRHRLTSCSLNGLVWCPEGESNPQGTKYRRILSSTVSSEPLGKFSTLLYLSTGYQKRRLHRCDPIRRVLNMELLQFYYSRVRIHDDRSLDRK
jgi:hypothetical protein